jgi:hypothetical protein
VTLYWYYLGQLLAWHLLNYGGKWQFENGKQEGRKEEEEGKMIFWHNVLQMLNEPISYSSFLFGILVWFNCKFRNRELLNYT